MSAKKSTSHLNPIESLGDFSQSIGTNAVDSLRTMGGSMLDQLLGVSHSESDKTEERTVSYTHLTLPTIYSV